MDLDVRVKATLLGAIFLLVSFPYFNFLLINVANISFKMVGRIFTTKILVSQDWIFTTKAGRR